ncbi:MAG: hypothetical protein ACLFOY_00170 [Desulfatibacillaceae bacterium]
MNDDITLQMIEEPVRFTHDGRIAVIDGIRAAMGSGQGADSVMETITSSHPELFTNCEEYTFSTDDTELVCGSDEWEAIFLTIFYHLLENPR